MYHNRKNYWSCSKLADSIRNYLAAPIKPESATYSEWKEWKSIYKKTHPKIYWLVEEFLDDAQDILMWPVDRYHDARIYVQNRFFDKLHYLPTRLKPGEYHEISERLLHGLFETLVDFVEVEKAWMNVVFSEDNWKKYDYPWFYKFRWLRWSGHFRCPRAGTDYLDWEISLGDESEYQSESAKIQKKLYDWWKNVRPNRPEPWEVSGLRDIREKEDDEDIFSSLDKPISKERTDAFFRCKEIEEEYDKEDTEMMIELLKIRKYLWT